MTSVRRSKAASSAGLYTGVSATREVSTRVPITTCNRRVARQLSPTHTAPFDPHDSRAWTEPERVFTDGRFAAKSSIDSKTYVPYALLCVDCSVRTEVSVVPTRKR